MSTLLATAVHRATTATTPPAPEKPTPANAFVLERMVIMTAPLYNEDGSFNEKNARDRLINYKVVKSAKGNRELEVTYIAGPERYKYTVNMTEQTVAEIIAHPVANKFDKMTMTAGLCAMRMTVNYGLDKC